MTFAANTHRGVPLSGVRNGTNGHRVCRTETRSQRLKFNLILGAIFMASPLTICASMFVPLNVVLSGLVSGFHRTRNEALRKR